MIGSRNKFLVLAALAALTSSVTSAARAADYAPPCYDAALIATGNVPGCVEIRSAGVLSF